MLGIHRFHGWLSGGLHGLVPEVEGHREQHEATHMEEQAADNSGEHGTREQGGTHAGSIVFSGGSGLRGIAHMELKLRAPAAREGLGEIPRAG